MPSHRVKQAGEQNPTDLPSWSRRSRFLSTSLPVITQVSAATAAVFERHQPPDFAPQSLACEPQAAKSAIASALLSHEIFMCEVYDALRVCCAVLCAIR